MHDLAMTSPAVSILSRRTRHIVLERGLGAIRFDYQATAFAAPYAHHRLELFAGPEIAVAYDMDTGSILLSMCGHAARDIPKLRAAYGAVLTLRDFEAGRIDALTPVLEVLPAGTYALDVVRLEQPFLVSPREDGVRGPPVNDHSAAYWTDLHELMTRTATPNLLIPIADLERCDGRVVDEYARALSETPEVDHDLLLLLEEPTALPDLSAQYHHPSDAADPTAAPDFGFNGTHVYFMGNNHFILDGHHRALAYAKIGAKPVGIRVRAIQIS